MPFQRGSSVHRRVEAGEGAGRRLVEAEAGHAGLPRGPQVRVGIPVDALVDVAQVGHEVGRVGRVDRLDPAEADERAPPSSRSGRRCPSRCPGPPASGGWIVPKNVVVVVDGLDVVDLRAVLRRELLEGGALRRVALVLVDVERPVGEVEDVAGRRLRGRGRRGRVARRGRRLGEGAASAPRTGPACRRPRGTPRRRPGPSPWSIVRRVILRPRIGSCSDICSSWGAARRGRRIIPRRSSPPADGATANEWSGDQAAGRRRPADRGTRGGSARRSARRR